MKYLGIVCGCLLFFASCGKTEVIEPEKEEVPVVEEVIEWELDWQDEFDVDGFPDSTIWSYETGYIRNSEEQYYTEKRLENARVEDGALIIEARKDNWEGQEITSASIHTYGKKDILYGRVEVRAKLPTGLGTWPAIWMLGNSINNGVNWPDCGELDIMENVGYDPHTIHANIHTKDYNHGIGTNKGDKIKIDAPYEDFHTYAMDWHEYKINFYVDDELYFTYYNPGQGDGKWPFDKNHYLIINLAIGGSWGGAQGVSSTLLPQKYYIDYVRVYKVKQ